MSASKKWDVVIIGGGVAGLQLGALLASDGNSVVVIEKNSRLGGRAFILEKDGFVLDNGVHLIRFGPKSAPARVMNHIGRKIEFIDLGTSYVLDEDGEIKVFPTKPLTFLRSKLFKFSDVWTVLKTIARIRRGSFDDLLETPVKEWLDANGIEGGLRRYFHLVAASMLVCPFIEKASTGEMLRNVQKVLKKRISVMYPKGGWKPLFQAWTETIKSNGEIVTSCKVEKLVIKNSRAVEAVATDGTVFTGERFVIAVPVQHMFEFLDEGDFPPEYVKLCKNLRPTAGISVDYLLKNKISDSTGLWYIWDPMSFGIFTSNLEPSLAPAGSQILTFFYPRPVEEMKDKEVAKKRYQELEQAIFKLFPDIPSNLIWKRVEYLEMVDGAEINVNQHRFKRPGFKAPGVDNLFLVGDSTCGDGAGGDVGHESVLECYEVMTGRAP